MKLTNDFIALILSKGIGTPLVLLETIIIGKILGPEEFGKWSLLIAAATILHSILINWTHSITVRFGCQEWVEHKSLNRTFSTRFPLVLGGMLVVIFLLWAQPMNWINKYYSLNSKLSWLIFLNMLSLWIMIETQSILQATNLIFYQAIITPIITCFSILFLISSYYFGKNTFIIISLGISFVKCVLWGMVYLYGLRKIKYHWELPNYPNLRNAFHFAWPLLPTFTLGYFSDWGDHILLAWFCNAKEVGLWGTSYQIMLGGISLNTMFAMILLPWLISRNHVFKDTSIFYLSKIIPAILSLWLPAMTMIITFFPMLFFVFMGKEFDSAHNALLILCMAVVINIFSSLYSILFTLQNRRKSTLLYNLVIVIANFLISLMLVPSMGINGAAVGTFISYLIGHFLYVWDQHNFLNLPMTKIIMFFLMTFFIGMLQYFAGANVWLRILCCLLSLAIMIIAIRKTNSIQPNFLSRMFGDKLRPAGFFIQRILTNTTANEYD